MRYPKLHVYDGRLITLDYTLNIQEIIEYDDNWDRGDEPKKERRFELHDKYDGFYWLSEHYRPDTCRRTSKAYNTVLHGFVLCCGAEVIVKLKDEQHGKDIIAEVARAIATSEDCVIFLNEDLTVSKYPKE